MNLLKQLQQRLQKLLQKLSLNKNNKTGDPEIHSPNLLQNILEIQSLEKTEQKQYFISRGALFLIISIQLLFIFLSLYNVRNIAFTTNLQTEIRGLEANVLSKRLTEEKIRDVIARTEILKQKESERIEYTPKILTLVSGIPSNVNLVRSYMQNDGITLTVETQTPLEISLLISNYFESKFAREIIIRSAILNQTENVFVTTLEIIF